MKTEMIAAAGLLAAAAKADSIFSGTGFGTYYYDIDSPSACSTDFSVANTGQVECSLTQVYTLEDVNSEYLVAMNHSQLITDMGKYCGKKVQVTVNGVKSDLPLFIGDGCERCSQGTPDQDTWSPSGAPGLDFSYSVLEKLSSDACTDGHIDISWEIVDETLWNFDTDGSGTPQGPASGAITTTPSPPGPTTSPSGSTAPTTTLVTTTSPTSASATPTGSSCTSNAWQCSSDSTKLQQCVNSSWTTVETCSSGTTCQGGSNPYCA
ncbi:hypothetical protein PISL3812_06402 [Talaromyces islandicus]|uniref:Uncharacterized protein n=1 Tax=Talaromyces islandicus TaxID=28573 RepID=A0A0U1M2R5_TALIS|nr:hypothetical protein PISL3812_06402 [Talaromyces islandicus]